MNNKALLINWTGNSKNWKLYMKPSTIEKANDYRITIFKYRWWWCVLTAAWESSLETTLGELAINGQQIRLPGNLQIKMINGIWKLTGNFFTKFSMFLANKDDRN